MLMQILEEVRRSGKRYEAKESDYHIQRIDNFQGLQNREDALTDGDERKLLVSNNGHSILFARMFIYTPFARITQQNL